MTILLTILFKPKLRCQLWYHCQLAFVFQGVIILCDWGTWKPPASLCHHDYHLIQVSLFSCLFSSAAQSCLTLCDPMDCSTPGFSVHHQHPEFVQIHVHRVGEAIQSSHPLSVPFSSHLQSFPASGSFPMSQFFTSGGQSIGVSTSASVLSMNIQDWFHLGWTGWISLKSKGHSRVFSNTTAPILTTIQHQFSTTDTQKHQFFCAQLSSWSNSHIHTWLLEWHAAVHGVTKSQIQLSN